MTDTERMLQMLIEARPGGVHSHELRRLGISGNPSQRAADLEAKGHALTRTSENRGKRPGTRYTLTKLAAGPPWPDGGETGAGAGGSHPSAGDAPSAPTLFDAETEPERPSAPSAFDPWSEAA